METDRHNPTDAERIEQFKRRLAAALKRILTETTDQNREENDDEKSNRLSQKRG